MPQIAAIKNTMALRSQELVDFMRRAFEEGPVAPGGLDACAQDVLNMIQSPFHHLLVGAEGGGYKAMSITSLPRDNITPYPFIILFYNEGSAEMRTELMKATLEFALSRGYTKAWAINGTKHSDEAWLKVLVEPFGNGERVGSVFQLEVK